MSPQRRTALVSVGAACLLIAIKLVAGIASSSLGLLAEAAHSGTDLAAALLTFFAVSVAVRPADRGHPFGHGKAQNLAALAEAGFLIVISLVIAAFAIARLAGAVEFDVDATWWTFAAIALVLVIDASRTTVSARAARRYRSDAMRANALHFGSDFAGTLAVLAGLSAAALGFPEGDAIAALFVAVLVVVAATAPRPAERQRPHGPVAERRGGGRAPRDRGARPARRAEAPPCPRGRRRAFRRCRHRHRSGRRRRAGPRRGGPSRGRSARAPSGCRRRRPRRAQVASRARSASGRSPRRSACRSVREIHNLTVLEVGQGVEISLHLKLPGDLRLDEAHDIAESVEQEILGAVPEAREVQTHLEPLAEVATAQEVAIDETAVAQAVQDETGSPPRNLRFVRTDDGIVAFLTLGLGGEASLADAHGRASAVEERVRSAVPEIADVVVHTEP